MPARLLVSILTFGHPANVLRQLQTLPAWLCEVGEQSDLISRIVIRNNDPHADVTAVADRLRDVQAEFPDIPCTLIDFVPNIGFGGGHNANIALHPSDYVLILNDDIGFPTLGWLDEAIGMLAADPRTACVGAEENPKYINPHFGNGLLPGSFNLHGIHYAEASVLLFARAAFDRLGGFSADYPWAMCEDSDLSLRAQQQGLRIAYLSIPHEHARSSSFNKLPGQVKASILEHNRAALFANWGESLTAGRVGRYEIFDVWSDGLGDVFCALPHLLARLAPLPVERRANIVVNTSHPELIGWLGLDGIRVTSVRDLSQLRTELGHEGIASLRSLRDVNFSLPFNMHALLPGALGLLPAGVEALADFAVLLRRLQSPRHGFAAQPGEYCVIHLEFDRDHDGRALGHAAAADLLRLCGEMFPRVVLIGRERRLTRALLGETACEIDDLQGLLSLSQLASVIAGARHFVGIDSFPAHIAQAAGVPSAIFFGAVHPLARTWNETNLWPLVSKLPCVGCYHTHLEPSVPFCMRRDVACAETLTRQSMAEALADMLALRPYDWQSLRRSWLALQAGMVKLARFHPAPPERLFRPALAANEQMSNAIYRITEQMGSLLRGHYQTSGLTALAAQVADLQAELYATRVALDTAKRRVVIADAAEATSAAAETTRIVQLASLALETARCRLTVADQWIDVAAASDDPQILLPVLQGGGGKLQLRLTCTVPPDDAVQVYWAVDEAAFSAEQMHLIPGSGGAQTANLMFDLAANETLRIRIDPCSGIGHARLRGSLGGFFALAPLSADERVAPPAVSDAEPASQRRRKGRHEAGAR